MNAWSILRRVTTAACIAAASSGSVAHGNEPSEKPEGKAGLVAGEIGRRVDQFMRELDADAGGFCGSALVAKGGKVLLEKGYGLADEETKKQIDVDALWDWASVTKQFTAAAVLKLQDQKKLKVDDSLKKFYPDAPADRANVTLRQLLNHTSGIEKGFREEWKFDATARTSLEKLMLGVPMTSKPGTKWEYNNAAYGLAAAIIERVSGTTYEEFCIEQLFKPAGMKDACFIGTPTLDSSRVPKIDRGRGFRDRPGTFAFAYGNKLTWGYRGCGGAVATTRDMFAWDRVLRTDKVLSKAASQDFYKPGLQDYSLGWFVGKTPSGLRVWHGGDVLGVRTSFLRCIDENVVVALAYSSEPVQDKKRTADALADLVLDAR